MTAPPPAATAALPALSPAYPIVNYLKNKCGLTHVEIQRRLLGGEVFDTIKGEGTDIDTKLLEVILSENDFYEKQSQKMLKDETMRLMSEVVEGWSVEIAKNQMRINEEEIGDYTAKLLPFGSYVLDLRSNSSDIDFICVCPNFIQRQTHFFQGLAQKLQSRADITNLATRTHARVPIITFHYKDIQIDISFCQLQDETIPRDIEKNIPLELLTKIKDQQSKTSLLGRKNNLMILELTGKQAENFKETLRVVKVWAKNRGISSNAMGFLGGISWAILVAKICQLFPGHKPAKLLYEFFFLYSMWNWKVPVRITPVPQGQTEDKASTALMQVITPASQYNSTERVNSITFKVIEEELKRANEILLSQKDVAKICRKVDFFLNYPLFVEIDICGKDDEKEYKDFQGLVESRIIRLLTNIQRYHKKQIEEGKFTVVPYPKMFKKNDKVYQHCNCLFIGLNIKTDTTISLVRAVKEWCAMMSQSRTTKASLNIRLFECTKEDLNDVEILESKKTKEVKEDPRLALMRRRQQQQIAS